MTITLKIKKTKSSTKNITLPYDPFSLIKMKLHAFLARIFRQQTIYVCYFRFLSSLFFHGSVGLKMYNLIFQNLIFCFSLLGIAALIV